MHVLVMSLQGKQMGQKDGGVAKVPCVSSRRYRCRQLSARLRRRTVIAGRETHGASGESYVSGLAIFVL